MKLKEFVKDRNEALLSLNKEKINAYIKKYEIPYIKEGDSFWPAIHKAITASTDLPIEFRRKSKQWLADRDFHSLDDGEL